MPYSNATKQAFADALRKLLEQKPFAKISVSHICDCLLYTSPSPRD